MRDHRTLSRLKKNMAYYQGKHKILEESNRDNRLVCNHAKDIKKGVFEAVVEAFDMSGSMNNDKDKDVIVNLTIKADSETLYKVVRKGQKKYDNRYHVVATI